MSNLNFLIKTRPVLWSLCASNKRMQSYVTYILNNNLKGLAYAKKNFVF